MAYDDSLLADGMSLLFYQHIPLSTSFLTILADMSPMLLVMFLNLIPTLSQCWLKWTAEVLLSFCTPYCNWHTFMHACAFNSILILLSWSLLVYDFCFSTIIWWFVRVLLQHASFYQTITASSATIVHSNVHCCTYADSTFWASCYVFNELVTVKGFAHKLICK